MAGLPLIASDLVLAISRTREIVFSINELLMSEPHLLFETEGDLGIATFQRAEVHHAINPQTVKELERLLDYWERKANIKCLVLTASGTKSFVAGGDLKYFSEIMGNKMAGVKFHRHMRNAMKKISNLPFPVICAANGDIYGGGC